MRQLHFTGFEGLRLVADASGPDEGVPVLLLHGGGQTRHSWRGTADAIAANGYRAITVDLRGHGESSWSPSGHYGFDAFLGDLQALLAGLASPPVIVGASLGGLCALLACGEHKAAARALVLVDVVPRMERNGVLQIVRFMQAHPQGFASVEEAANAVAAYLPHRPRPSSLDGLGKNLRADVDGRFRWHWDPELLLGEQRPDPETVAERLRHAARAIDIPTLLVRGSRSELVSEAGVRDFLQLIPSAEYADVRDAGHMVAGDDNAAFSAAVTGFLQRSVGSGPQRSATAAA